MDGKTHLAAGVMTGIGAVYFKNKFDIDINVLDSTLFIIGCGFGSLLPDIDLPDSMLGHFVPFVSYFMEHRTITHSLFFMLVTVLIALVCKSPYSLIVGLCVGIGTHLLLDSITPMGLPYLLFPFHCRERYKKHF